MIRNTTLKYLAAQKRKDAEVLLKQKRNSAAVYLMGYALEFSIKRKITSSLGFDFGFPETIGEYMFYKDKIDIFNLFNPNNRISQLRQLKSHNLEQLLDLSGQAAKIETVYKQEWETVSSWNPANRYKAIKYRNNRADIFINSAKKILKEII